MHALEELTEEDAAGEGLDIGSVGGNGVGDAHARRASITAVWLVEGENGVGAEGRDRGVDVGGEDGGQGRRVVEEHRDEGQGWIEARRGAVGDGEVVVRPGDAGRLTGDGEVGGVGVVAVCEAAFAATGVDGWI